MTVGDIGEHWLDIGQAAVHFGVSDKTIRRWIERREELGLVAEQVHGKWQVDAESVTWKKPASSSPVDAALVAELRRELAAERQRSDALLGELGRWRGRYEEMALRQDRLLLEHHDELASSQRAAEQLQGELSRLKGRGFWRRLFNLGGL
nr:helix-turn-helix domain-containing protein [Desulfuromonas sp. CSMB_57]